MELNSKTSLNYVYDMNPKKCKNTIYSFVKMTPWLLIYYYFP